MRTFVTILSLSVFLPCFSNAQDSSPPSASSLRISGNTTPNVTLADYAVLNQRVLERKTQFELLSQLSQEHKKRAQDAARDQTARSQWEMELAKELSEKAAGIWTLLNNVHQKQAAFEHAQTNMVPSISETTAVSGSSMGNANETAFLGKVDERLVAVQQEITDALEAGKVYAAQLLTNKTSYEVSQITYLLQSNGDEVRRLRKEVFDLELKKLEFRALRQR